MSEVLEMLGLLLYIVGVIAAAAGITALVVKISPTKDANPVKQR